jgi:hypothetical protein
MKQKQIKYYAVKKGKNLGIFNNWKKCIERKLYLEKEVRVDPIFSKCHPLHWQLKKENEKDGDWNHFVTTLNDYEINLILK